MRGVSGKIQGLRDDREAPDRACAERVHTATDAGRTRKNLFSSAKRALKSRPEVGFDKLHLIAVTKPVSGICESLRALENSTTRKRLQPVREDF
jgi:hypothetical protein